MDRPLLLLSDTHVSRSYGTEAGDAVADLLESHKNAELVLAGDIFDLSLDAADVPVGESLDAALTPHHKLLSALRQHVHRGQKVTLIPGNHDSGLDDRQQTRNLRVLLQAPNDDTVEVSSWFVRRGSAHIEHGHLYDPDCATDHPLADPNRHSEGLGTALMRRFISPHNATAFAHKNGTTPLAGLKAALELWGADAPRVIFDYFRTATHLCVEAARNRDVVTEAKRLGQTRLREHANQAGLTADTLQELLATAPVPTHHSFASTFHRLYFDRILAGCSVAVGASLLTSAGLSNALSNAPLVSESGSVTVTGALLAAAGGGYLLSSRDKKKQYAGTVVKQLETAAQEVRRITGSKLVIFGHTHVPVDQPGYVNLGSFGYGRPKRPYVLLSTSGVPERGWF